MTEREIAITLIVLVSVLSILTTPFMMMKRGSARLTTPQKRSPLGWAVVIASNVAITILLLWLGYYLYQTFN